MGSDSIEQLKLEILQFDPIQSGGEKMARLPRFDLPGLPQHVIQRGNNRDVIFVAEADYQFYLEKLGDACQKFQRINRARLDRLTKSGYTRV